MRQLPQLEDALVDRSEVGLLRILQLALHLGTVQLRVLSQAVIPTRAVAGALGNLNQAQPLLWEVLVQFPQCRLGDAGIIRALLRSPPRRVRRGP